MANAREVVQTGIDAAREEVWYWREQVYRLSGETENEKYERWHQGRRDERVAESLPHRTRYLQELKDFLADGKVDVSRFKPEQAARIFTHTSAFKYTNGLLYVGIEYYDRLREQVNKVDGYLRLWASDKMSEKPKRKGFGFLCDANPEHVHFGGVVWSWSYPPNTNTLKATKSGRVDLNYVTGISTTRRRVVFEQADETKVAIDRRGRVISLDNRVGPSPVAVGVLAGGVVYQAGWAVPHIIEGIARADLASLGTGAAEAMLANGAILGGAAGAVAMESLRRSSDVAVREVKDSVGASN